MVTKQMKIEALESIILMILSPFRKSEMPNNLIAEAERYNLHYKHREAPPNGTVVMVKYPSHKSWYPKISTGKFGQDGKLLIHNSHDEFDIGNGFPIEEWKPLTKDGKVPESLT